MSTSEHERVRRARQVAVVYAAVTLFCGVFSFVYEYFSHQIYAVPMICLFLYPLLGGAAATVLAWLSADRLPLDLCNCGVATLAVGSALRGVMEIAGTDSVYLMVFTVVGAGLLLAAAVVFFRGRAPR